MNKRAGWLQNTGPWLRRRRTARGVERQRGFTLIELLLVLVILALIGGLVLPRLIGTAEGAKVKAASSSISRLSMAVETFYLDTGSMPDRLEDLVDNPGDASGWNGPYVKRQLLEDPWENGFQYESPGQHGDFDIYSYGADGQQGGEGNNADVTSWQ